MADEDHIRLAFLTGVAPTVTGVFPLIDGHADQAHKLADRLTRRGIPAIYDESGSIGRSGTKLVEYDWG